MGLAIMSPKKRVKMPKTGAASAVKNDDQVFQVLRAVSYTIEEIHKLVANHEGDPELMPFPVLYGGTFKSILQRA